jgi:glycosyltransferase involved in cell wall biosynthesis
MKPSSTKDLVPKDSVPYSQAIRPARAGLVRREKIRVLFIIDQLCESGGAEHVLLKMIDHLPRDQFDCLLLTFKHNPAIERFRRLPCPFYVFRLGRTYDLNALRVALKVRKLIRSHRIDIVHTFHETSDIWGGIVARASGCRVLISSRRDMGILRSRKHMFGYRIANMYVKRVLTVSNRVREYCIRSDGLSAAKVVTIHNGLDLRAFDNDQTSKFCRRSLDIPEHVPLITTVALVRRIKGIDVLLRAAALVCRLFPQAVFLVVGGYAEADYFEELKRLSVELGLGGNLKFAGHREDVIGILKSTDIFCLPSRSEGFSNALIEAMACALPCVATNVGGNNEAITDGADGYIVPSENAETMAQRILNLLRFPEKSREIGLAARRKVEQQFTVDLMLRKLVGVYGELVNSKLD